MEIRDDLGKAQQQPSVVPSTFTVTDAVAAAVAARAASAPGASPATLVPTVWESEMVTANRVAAVDPPIDDTDPIRKFSIDPGSHIDLQNPAKFSPKGKPIRNFSIDFTSSIRTRLRTPFLRTPFPRLLNSDACSSGSPASTSCYYLKKTNLEDPVWN